MKTIIHVNRHNIAHNHTHEDKRPVFTAKTYKSNRRGSLIILMDSQGRVVGQFVYRPNKPLPCGARAWFETDLNVIVREIEG